jgi:hypothetical protein
MYSIKSDLFTIQRHLWTVIIHPGSIRSKGVKGSVLDHTFHDWKPGKPFVLIKKEKNQDTDK